MPELLLELFSEEIPARMQAQAAKDLERLVVGALSDRGLLFESARAFAGPRRLTLAITGLPAKQPDVSEERKGPRVGANEKAIEGFLKSAGVTLDQCTKQSDAKGEFYVATISRKGRATPDVLAEVLPEVIAKLPWPKSMRWGEGDARWVRPLHSIIATFDGEAVSFEFAGVKSGNTTRGHRFLSDGKPITVRRFDDYVDKLKSAHVIVDAAERREIIQHEAKQKAFALGLELVVDEGLLNEVTGLAEWPVVLVGTIDAAFMDLPPEILQTTMRAHQKYFALRASGAASPPPQHDENGSRHPEERAERAPKDGRLANKFVVVANMVADDGGKAIVAGNERVLRARLSDAKFFWDQDRKTLLVDRVPALQDIVFHAKLGTQHERVQRIRALAREIADKIGADPEKADRAALLCKADLTTGVVGEFPELQGIMGRYYALADGEDEEVAVAIRNHYRPLGPKDRVSGAPVSIAVALADKIDTLVGFFAIGEKPTGSGDPYALRRAALGYIRTLLDNFTHIETSEMLESAHYWIQKTVHARTKKTGGDPIDLLPSEDCVEQLMDFFVDRLKVVFRERGARHDLIDAIFAVRDEDDFVRLVDRTGQLQGFLKDEDGSNLLIAYRRAANILREEEKRDKRSYRGEATRRLFETLEERELADALDASVGKIARSVNDGFFVGAMDELAKLRAPVDRFFDKVTVNVDDKALRENRLKLLSQIVATAHQVADFSKIEG